jgi:hypothetical protein
VVLKASSISGEGKRKKALYNRNFCGLSADRRAPDEGIMVKPKLPATFPESDMIDTVAHWFDLAHVLLQKESSHL